MVTYLYKKNKANGAADINALISKQNQNLKKELQNQMEQKQNSLQQQPYQNKEIEDLIESNWINIKDGETRVLQFITDKSKVVDKTDFAGKPTKKVQFCVTDINKPGKEKYFEVSRIHAAKIYEDLKAGKTILEISRLGTGKDTRFFVKAVR